MVLLEEQPGRPCRPLVFLPRPDVAVDRHGASADYASFLAEEGWAEFQRVKARYTREESAKCDF